MASASKRKGDAAEREAAALLSDLLGLPVRRKLGAGRQDDCGDLDGLPDWTLEVKNRPGDVLRALREGLADAEREQANAGTTFGAALVRRPGGRWFVTMSLEQFATVVRELASVPAVCSGEDGEETGQQQEQCAEPGEGAGLFPDEDVADDGEGQQGDSDDRNVLRAVAHRSPDGPAVLGLEQQDAECQDDAAGDESDLKGTSAGGRCVDGCPHEATGSHVARPVALP